jgi:pyrroline-5-carboxylate reductase
MVIEKVRQRRDFYSLYPKPCILSCNLVGTMNTAAFDQNLSQLRVAVLGAGKMGGILLQAFLKQQMLSPDQLLATVAHEDRAAALSAQWGVEVSTDNLAAAQRADVILLGVKPFQVPALIAEIKPALTPEKLLLSFAASVKTGAIEAAAGIDIPVIRAMPNTPSMLGAGIAALCRGKFVSEAQMEMAARMFEAVGRTVIVDEKHMDAVTGLSASGPAFIYIILESLAEAGVKVGLPRDIATLLAAQTTFGAAKMVLETGYHPALLKDAVTTPAGCTIDGILELEEGGLRVTLIKAVMRAAQRAKELAAGD